MSKFLDLLTGENTSLTSLDLTPDRVDAAVAALLHDQPWYVPLQGETDYDTRMAACREFIAQHQGK